MATKPATKAAAKPAPAAAKPAAKKTTAVVAWKEELAQAAAAQAKQQRAVSQGSSINTAGGVLSFNGAPIEDNNLDAIVLDAVITNVFYLGDYDPSNPASPVCYASGYDEDTMAPHEKAPDPQNSDCKTCPHNQWGSADKGRGKACKNQVKLALVSADAAESGENAKESEIITLNVPVTSVKAWTIHQSELTKGLGMPTWAVITNIEPQPNPKGGFMLKFSLPGESAVDFDVDGVFEAIKAKLPMAKEINNQPYPEFVEEEKPAKRSVGRGNVASKTAAGKRKF
jgi:hypothetical protein